MVRSLGKHYTYVYIQLAYSEKIQVILILTLTRTRIAKLIRYTIRICKQLLYGNNGRYNIAVYQQIAIGYRIYKPNQRCVSNGYSIATAVILRFAGILYIDVLLRACLTIKDGKADDESDDGVINVHFVEYFCTSSQ